MVKKTIVSFLFLFLTLSASTLTAIEPKSQPELLNTENADIAKLTEPFVFKFKNEASLKLYGKMEMLTYADTTSPAISDWLGYVYSRDVYNGKQGSMSMSVRGTPFGLLFNVPKGLEDFDLNARLEMDFVGGFTAGTTSAYSPLVRLKQAYVSMDSEHFGILLGQTFGVFSPLFPAQASWFALGTSGNPWIRLPQIRFTVKYNPVKFEVSVNRPMAANVATANQLDDIISDGEQSKTPIVMTRLGYAGDFSSWQLETGASGVFGREKIYRSETAGILDKKLYIWMAGYDLKIVTKYINFTGELFIGENLNTFYAGIMQGIYTDVANNFARSVNTYGGWAQITIKPTDKLYFNLCSGVDNPRDSDLVVSTARSMNNTSFVSANYIFNKWFNIGIETSYMETAYVDDNKTNSNFRTLLRTTFIY